MRRSQGQSILAKAFRYDLVLQNLRDKPTSDFLIRIRTRLCRIERTDELKEMWP
ncbi:MAG: hypothetical protein O2945_22425 [Planctomycetota bacterium]|nr:hypothetical protein [Planctomycetota bacterium]